MTHAAAKCPHCGRADGYRRVVRMSGKGYLYYDENGVPTNNTHLHDDLIYKEAAAMQCVACLKTIGRIAPEKELTP